MSRIKKTVSKVIVGSCILAVSIGVAKKLLTQAQNRACTVQILELAQALRTNASQNDGVFPRSLETLVVSGEISATMLICPKSNKPYEYIGGQVIEDVASMTLMLYERPGDHIGTYCDLDGRVGRLQGERQKLAISFTRQRVTELHEKAGRDCGVLLRLDDSLAWWRGSEDEHDVPLSQGQENCLKLALKRAISESNVPRCTSKWIAIVDNDYDRFRPTGERLFHLVQTDGQWLIKWRKSQSPKSPLRYAPEEFSLRIHEFVAAIPDSERSRARQFFDEEITNVGR